VEPDEAVALYRAEKEKRKGRTTEARAYGGGYVVKRTDDARSFTAHGWYFHDPHYLRHACQDFGGILRERRVVLKGESPYSA
jgi:hypothetical protein